MDLRLLLQNSPAFGLLPAPQIEALALALQPNQSRTPG